MKRRRANSVFSCGLSVVICQACGSLSDFCHAKIKSRIFGMVFSVLVILLTPLVIFTNTKMTSCVQGILLGIPHANYFLKQHWFCNYYCFCLVSFSLLLSSQYILSCLYFEIQLSRPFIPRRVRHAWVVDHIDETGSERAGSSEVES